MSDARQFTLPEISNEAVDWLNEQAFPLWYERGVDWDRGGFFECLDFNTLQCSKDFRRLRVVTRQIYVFSAAHRLGFKDGQRAVEHGISFLLNRAKLDGGGFANRFDLNGNIIDHKLDLYDLAFCLFALAHGYQTLNEPSLKREAVRLATFIHQKMLHPAGGFVESIPASFPRRQNPHMHLLEAAIEWLSISKDDVFLMISREILSLFYNKFYFSRVGCLLEFFDEDLIPPAGREHRVAEPGHQFEWFWLLKRFESVADEVLLDYQKLYDFGRNFGLCAEDGLLFAQVFEDGSPDAGHVRLWPHTEWLKAELLAIRAPQPTRVIEAWQAIKKFLDCPRKGLWFENWDREIRQFIVEPSPASSLYHLTLSIETLKAHAGNRGSLN